MRKTLFALATLGSLIGCGPFSPAPVVHGPSYIEGVVTGERFNADMLRPYGFVLRLNSGDYRAFDVIRASAASVDSLIEQGDKIKIDKKGLLNECFTLENSQYISILEKAQKSH